MGDITKDSFRENNLHTKVLFQRGKDVMDYELNEMQDILRTTQYRALVAESGGLEPASNDDGYLVVGTGVGNLVTLKAGSLFTNGIPILLTEDFNFSDVPTNNGGSPINVFLYLTVSEQEVTDPAMVPQMGETTRRRKLFLEVGCAAVLPDDSPQQVWQGGTRHFALARITRNPGVAEVAAGDVADLRKRLPAFTVKRYTDQFAITSDALAANLHNYNPTGGSDTFVIRLNPTTDINLTGINADVQYRRKTLINVGSGVIHILPEAGASVAVNRFVNGADIYPGGSLEIIYDDANDRWRALTPGEAAQLADEIIITDFPWTQPEYPNPYNPPGWDLATVVRLGGENIYIQGMQPASRIRKRLVNIGFSPIGLPGNSYGPPEESKIRVGAWVNQFVLEAGASVDIMYDTASQLWQVVTMNYSKQAEHDSLTITGGGLSDHGNLTIGQNVDVRSESSIGLQGTATEVVYVNGSHVPTSKLRYTVLSTEDLSGAGWGAGPNGKYLEAYQAQFYGGTYQTVTGAQGFYGGGGDDPNVFITLTYGSDSLQGGGSSAEPLRAPIRLPTGALLQKIEALVQETHALPSQPIKLTFSKRSLPLDPSPENGGGTEGWMSASETSTQMTHNGFQLLTINPNLLINNEIGSTGIRITPSNTDGGSRVWWVKLTWLDPGPKNN